MYHIYQTDGWILGSINVGEANRYIDIFTPELGLVRGVAQGVRKLNSKLRYGLQDYSYGKISLVKGREVWRVINAERADQFNWIYGDKDIFRLVCRIFGLLKRLIRGEEGDRIIFDDLNLAIGFMGGNIFSREELFLLEIVLVFRILQKLGYVGRDQRFDYLADFSAWEPGVLLINNETRAELLKQINSSLAHSHL